jgi:hypothetical protein
MSGTCQPVKVASVHVASGHHVGHWWGQGIVCVYVPYVAFEQARASIQKVAGCACTAACAEGAFVQAGSCWQVCSARTQVPLGGVNMYMRAGLQALLIHWSYYLSQHQRRAR